MFRMFRTVYKDGQSPCYFSHWFVSAILSFRFYLSTVMVMHSVTLPCMNVNMTQIRYCCKALPQPNNRMQVFGTSSLASVLRPGSFFHLYTHGSCQFVNSASLTHFVFFNQWMHRRMFNKYSVC